MAAELTIPAEKMKASRQGAGRQHIVYLSQQALDLFMQLHVLASGSPYVLPSFGQSQYGTVSLSSLNRAAAHTVELAQRKGLLIEKFVHTEPPQHTYMKQVITLIGLKGR